MPHIVATHANKRKTCFFNPNAGCLVEASQENIDKARCNNPEVNFQWLKDGKFNSENVSDHEICSSYYWCRGQVHPL